VDDVQRRRPDGLLRRLRSVPAQPALSCAHPARHDARGSPCDRRRRAARGAVLRDADERARAVGFYAIAGLVGWGELLLDPTWRGTARGCWVSQELDPTYDSSTIPRNEPHASATIRLVPTRMRPTPAQR